jgi:hypothetical protein
MAQQPLVSQELLIIKASHSHSDASHLLGLLWVSNQPDAQTCIWKYTESVIPANERPQTHSLDRPANGIGFIPKYGIKYLFLLVAKYYVFCLMGPATLTKANTAISSWTFTASLGYLWRLQKIQRKWITGDITTTILY